MPIDVRLQLPFQSPYALAELLHFFSARVIQGVELVSAQRYVRAVTIDGALGVVVVEKAAHNALNVWVRSDRRIDESEVALRLTRMFDLTTDITSVEAQLTRDPMLFPLVRARPGLRVPGGFDGFELAVRAILGQQISVRAACGLLSALVATHGVPLPPSLLEFGVTHCFPEPSELARADLSALRVPGARRTALSALAEAVTAEPAILRPHRSLAEALVFLQKLRGIGPWTAQYIAMRLHREPDAFPEGDAGLRRALSMLLAKPVSLPELTEHAERWRPFRAYAALHLWSHR